MKRFASLLPLLLLLSVVLVLLPQIHIAHAQLSTRVIVTIHADGTISPEDAPVQRDGNIYTLKYGITGLKVERNDTIIDGNRAYLAAYKGGGTVISLYNVRNVTVKNCVIGESTVGIDVDSSSQITILNNRITDADISMWWEAAAIRIKHETSNIRIVGNTIENSKWGIFVYEESPNLVIHHNNFVQNSLQDLYVVNRSLSSFSATWDDGREGNYWNKYYGIDDDGDGIGDTPYSINENNQDRCPLMEPISFFDAGTWTWTQTRYFVYVVSNSQVSNFSFNPERTLVQFNVSGDNGATGFCRVTIPKELIYADENDWTVLVDDNPVTPSVNEDADTTHLYFTYSHSSKTVEILGTYAIPEFPSWLILPLFLMATLVGITAKKRLTQSVTRCTK